MKFVILASSLILFAFAQDERLNVAKKACNFGVTFYTAQELVTIMKCADAQVYQTPNNDTAILQKAKECIINNSASKAMKALSLYSNVNSCLDPDNIGDLAVKWAPSFRKQANAIVTKTLTAITDCKKNNKKAEPAKQEACAQKGYAAVKAVLTKNYVDNVCIKFTKANCNKKQYGCALKYLPQVMNITSYNCSKLTIN